MKIKITWFIVGIFCFLPLVSVADQDEEEYIEQAVAQMLEAPMEVVETKGNSTLCNILYPQPKHNNVPYSDNVVVTGQVLGAVGSVLGVFSGGGTAATQAARIHSVFMIVTCKDDLDYENTHLPLSYSPTYMSIGDDNMHYITGGVVGNYAILGGVSAIAAGLAKWKGAKIARFPGIMILPVFYLVTPTTFCDTLLLRFGEVGQKALGGVTLALPVVGTALIGWFLRPSNFGAEWNDDHGWISKDGPTKYVEKYGMLFSKYREGRTGFVIADLSMSIAAGVFGAYSEKSNCKILTDTALGVYGAYAVANLVLLPYVTKGNAAYFGFLAVAQTAPLVIAVASNADLAKHSIANYITTGTPIVLNMLILARSVYDGVIYLRALYRFCHQSSGDRDWGDPLMEYEYRPGAEGTIN